MRLKQQLTLRKVGSNYMIVDVIKGEADMTNVYTLNSSAARLWQYAEGKEFSEQMLAQYLCEVYEVEYAVALADVKAQVEDWLRSGLVVND